MLCYAMPSKETQRAKQSMCEEQSKSKAEAKQSTTKAKAKTKTYQSQSKGKAKQRNGEELSQSNDAMEYDLTGMALFGSEAKEDFLARPSGWPLSYNPRGQTLER